MTHLTKELLKKKRMDYVFHLNASMIRNTVWQKVFGMTYMTRIFFIMLQSVWRGTQAKKQ
jgi:hypothetical protein